MTCKGKKKKRKILYSVNSILIYVKKLFHKKKKKRDELFKYDEILRRFLWKLIFFFSLAKNESNQVARWIRSSLNNQSFARFSRNEIQLNEAIEFRVEEITVIFLMCGTDAPSSFRKGMFGEQVYENFHLSFFPFFLPCFGKQLKKKGRKDRWTFFRDCKGT